MLTVASTIDNPGQSFEHLCLAALRMVGVIPANARFELRKWVQSVSDPSEVFEADIWVEEDRAGLVEKTFVECKFLQGRVGRISVQKLADTRGLVGADKAILVSVSGFSHDAIVRARQANIKLVHLHSPKRPGDFASWLFSNAAGLKVIADEVYPHLSHIGDQATLAALPNYYWPEILREEDFERLQVYQRAEARRSYVRNLVQSFQSSLDLYRWFRVSDGQTTFARTTSGENLLQSQKVKLMTATVRLRLHTQLQEAWHKAETGSPTDIQHNSFLSFHFVREFSLESMKTLIVVTAVVSELVSVKLSVVGVFQGSFPENPRHAGSLLVQISPLKRECVLSGKMESNCDAATTSNGSEYSAAETPAFTNESSSSELWLFQEFHAVESPSLESVISDSKKPDISPHIACKAAWWTGDGIVQGKPFDTDELHSKPIPNAEDGWALSTSGLLGFPNSDGLGIFGATSDLRLLVLRNSLRFPFNAPVKLTSKTWSFAE